mgnify:CR=1 FL=1
MSNTQEPIWPNELPPVGSMLLLEFKWAAREYRIPAMLLTEYGVDGNKVQVLIGEAEHTLVWFNITADRKGWTLSNMRDLAPSSNITWMDVSVTRLDAADV